MILIGSHAARLGGFYPAWRAAADYAGSGDIDVICDPEALEQLRGRCGEPQMVGPTHRFSSPHGPVDVTVDAEIAAMMRPLCPEVRSVADLGMMHLASPEVIWATLLYTAGGVPCWYEKSLRDLKFYDALVKARGRLSEQHRALAHRCRERMLEAIFARFDR